MSKNEITQRLQEALDDGKFGGDGPEPSELEYWLEYLMESAPDEYEPWLFRCAKGGKDPYLGQGSWKDESNQLTPEEAVEAMGDGFNIGIAGTADDRLVNVDIDDDEEIDIEDLQPSTRVRSQSRSGRHQQHFSTEPGEIPNIAHPDAGEVRTEWQYVLAPGSHIDPDDEEEYQREVVDEAPDEQEPLVGYYTVEVAREPTTLDYDQLPDPLREYYEESKRKAEEAKKEREKKDPDEYDSSGNSSAIFDLDVRDIVPTEGGSTNPTERWSALFHGSSTDANMSVSDEGKLHCWRHTTAHGALQVLAVLSNESSSGDRACMEVGAGHSGSAEGPCRLSSGELNWAAWKYAKKRGYIKNTDPIPHSALVHVAIENGICEPSDVEDGWKLPYPDYVEALTLVSEKYGLDPGRRANAAAATRETTDDGETTRTRSTAAILPDVPRGKGKQGISTGELRNRVCKTIQNAMVEERNVAVDAIMSGGKTYGTFKAADNLDHQITYFAPRLGMYDQAAEYAKEVGIPEDEIKVLPSMKRDCPTWDGQHGGEWAKKVKRQYYSGARPKVIHEMNDGIPCREGHDGECPYEAMWDFDPDDYQVIIGHYKHSHVTHVTMGRTVVFDEDPAEAFTTHVEGGVLQQSINTFLDMEVSPPVDDFDELLRIRRDDQRVKECERWFNQMVQADEFEFGSPDSANVVALDGENYHGYAPHAVYAILNTTPLEEGYSFERGFMPGGLSGSLFFNTSDEHGDYYVEFRESPELHYANAVLALDGTPLTDESRPDPHRVREWSQSLGIDLEHLRVLSDEERRNYIRDTLGHSYVQVSESAMPYSSGRYNNMTEDAALCAAVRDFYGDGEAPIVTTSKTVADEYRDAGFEEQGLAKKIDHTGNLRGTNRYAEERLGIQLGSSHHGDHEIRRRAAWLRETVDVSGKGMDRDYGSDLANSILRQMRENQTAQNVMRLGRDGGGALIVLKTAAFPDWLPVAGKGGVTPWPDGMKEVLVAWNDLSPGPLKTVEVGEIAGHDAVSVSERQVRNALDSFVELGYVKKGDHPNDGRKNVYVDDGLGGVDPEEYAEVELPDLEWPAPAGGDSADVPEVRLTNIYTSDFDSSEADLSEEQQSALPMGVGDATGDMDRGDPPTEE